MREYDSARRISALVSWTEAVRLYNPRDARTELRKAAIVTKAEVCELPANALLARYRDYTPAGAAGARAYTDCFCADLARAVTLAEYVDAFYRGPVIRIERAAIGVLLGRRSTAADIAALAQGSADSFSAWKVEDRAPDQLLLCDYTDSTRSWLMCAPTAEGTRLYFGSAVVPIVDRKTGQAHMGALFKPLMGFHKAYSRHLLQAAHARLARA